MSRQMAMIRERLGRALRVAQNGNAPSVECAVIGGYAYNLHRGWPNTRPRDFDVAATARYPLGLIGEFKFVRDHPLGGMEWRHAYGFTLDWIVRTDRLAPLFADAIRHAEQIEGLPVASKEHLLVMALMARQRFLGFLWHIHRNKDLDMALALLQREGLDLGRALQIAREYGDSECLELIMNPSHIRKLFSFGYGGWFTY